MVSGQPPPRLRDHLLRELVDLSMSGRSSRSTLMFTNSSFMSARGGVVLEGLVRHDVAPVARRVADRQQDRLALRARALERLRAPTGYQSTGLCACCCR